MFINHLLHSYLIYFLGEGQEAKKVTFRELRKRVSVLASALKRSGVKRGDCVAGKVTCT